MTSGMISMPFNLMSFEGLGGNTESDQHNVMDYKTYDQNVNETICGHM